MNKSHRVALAGLLIALPITSAHAEKETPADIAADAPASRARRPRHLRMSLEMATVFAAGHRWYWRDNGKPNEVDWQLPDSSAAIEAKLTGLDGWRFDGNPYDINALGHPGFGMLTHFLARKNGYGMAQSFLISTVASGAWEVILEKREFGSINDMATTSPAGIPLGETAYQMIDHWREVDLEVRTGVGTENGATLGVTSVRGELDQTPHARRGRVAAGQRVGFEAELETDAVGLRSYSGGARTSVAGIYRNRGLRRLMGTVDARYTYRNQEDRPERQGDLMTTVAVGPSVDYRLRTRGLTIGVSTDLSIAFGLLKPQAFASWRSENPNHILRNSLSDRARPYYFGGGATMDPRLNLSYGSYFAGARFSGAVFRSFDGADRDQEQVTTTTGFSDRDARAQAALGYRRGSMSLMLDGRLHHRTGSAGELRATTGERTAMFTVGLHR